MRPPSQLLVATAAFVFYLIDSRRPASIRAVTQRAFFPAVLLCACLTACFDPPPVAPGTDQAGTSGTTTGLASGSSGSNAESSGNAGGTGSFGCTLDADCDDGDPCSDDRCETGSCTHQPRADDPACVCALPSDCPQLPENTSCGTRACVEGVCARSLAEPGTTLPDVHQTAEDCKRLVCDGLGGVVAVPDGSDVPDDGLECTDDRCDEGQPSNSPLPEREPCSAGTCDGKGACAGCSVPEDCGAGSTFCATTTCIGSLCGQEATAEGTPLPQREQRAGDCQRIECDGLGNPRAYADGSDTPDSDGNPCTVAVCNDGTPEQESLPANSSCGEGQVCSEDGACVECTLDAQCPDADPCNPGACVDNQCTTVFAATGTSCNDGLFCTVTDTCNGSGSCTGVGNPCPGADGDNDCSESCNEVSNNCTGNDTNGSDCGNCRSCANGTCLFECGTGEACCPGSQICLPPNLC